MKTLRINLALVPFIIMKGKNNDEIIRNLNLADCILFLNLSTAKNKKNRYTAQY